MKSKIVKLNREESMRLAIFVDKGVDYVEMLSMTPPSKRNRNMEVLRTVKKHLREMFRCGGLVTIEIFTEGGG